MAMDFVRSWGVFVTGTDTGVGKTTVAAGLVRALRDQGTAAVGLKPVVSGALRARASGAAPVVAGQGAAPPAGGDWYWEDLERLSLADAEALPPEARSVVRLRMPAAPAFAAAAEGVRMDGQDLVHQMRSLVQTGSFAVVEGVGGFRVPLLHGFDTADLARALDLPCVLVVGLRLGCINHALLTAEAIRVRGLSLCAWVANAAVDTQYAFGEQTVAALEEALELPCVARLPVLPGAASLDQCANLAAWRVQAELQVRAAAAELRGLAHDLLE